MKFIGLFHLKHDVNQARVNEVIARRIEYKFPDGVQLINEYWTPTKLAVVATFEADDPAALMMNTINWLDAFDAEIIPAVEFGEAVKKLPRMLRK